LGLSGRAIELTSPSSLITWADSRIAWGVAEGIIGVQQLEIAGLPDAVVGGAASSGKHLLAYIAIRWGGVWLRENTRRCHTRSKTCYTG